MLSISNKCSTFAMYLGDTGTIKFNNLKRLTIMATKVKIQREFTFKAYVIAAAEIEPATDQHMGEYMTKSECHYYCEKAVLDYVKTNAESVERDGHVYLIYKVSTVEDSTMPDMLVERISVKDGKINIQ